MAFNTAQYEATAEKLNSGVKTFSTKLHEVGPKAESTANHWYVPDAIGDALIWTANQLVELGSWALNKIQELLQGIVAPIYMYKNVYNWQQDVRGKASGVAGSTTADQLQSLKHWTGDAATAYTTAVKGQPLAAAKVGTCADKVATGLALCATAGLAFYVTLAVVLYQFIASMIAAIVALGSLVFSWAGAIAVVGEISVSSAAIIAAVAALLALLGAELQQMSAIEGEATDISAYPGGHWPVAAP